MADMTAACVLMHRQLLTCRRGTLAVTISDKLSQGSKVDCYEMRAKLVDLMMRALCNYDADATLNCLTNDQACDLIQQCYRLLPEEC
jgi:inosine-uridine nucleoside N-ribohydrolase